MFYYIVSIKPFCCPQFYVGQLDTFFWFGRIYMWKHIRNKFSSG